MSSNSFAISSSPAPGLSQVERVVDTFFAPSKTFADILRSAAWWLPFLLLVLSTFASTAVVDRQVGFDRVSENQAQASPRQAEALSQLTPEQRASRMAITARITRISSYAGSLFVLVFLALYSLILWAAFNFGLGAQTTYARVFAVSLYAALPYLFISLLTAVTLYLGNNAENYDLRNPIGTNLAYYLPNTAPWLKALLSAFDLIKLWSTGLQVLGMAIIAKKTLTQSAVIVGAIWIAGTLLSVVMASAFS